MALQRNPDTILWMTLDDETLLSMTYDPKQNVVAWAKHLLQIGEGQADVSELSGYGPTNYPLLQTTTAQADPGLTETTEISTWDEFEAIFSPSNIQSITNSGGKPLVTTTSPHGLTAPGWVQIAFTHVYDAALLIDSVPSPTEVIINTAYIEDRGTGGWIGNTTDINITGNYYLSADLDASETAVAGYRNYDDAYGSDIGWMMFPFRLRGTLDGNGYKITNFYQAATQDMGTAKNATYGGLFYEISSTGKVANLTVEGADITCRWGGVFAFWTWGSTEIYNCHTSGDLEIVVNAAGYTHYVGGFIGFSPASLGGGSVYDSTADVSVVCTDSGNQPATLYVGGFKGFSDNATIIHNCYVTGTVDSSAFTGVTTQATGGFVGFISDTGNTIDYCYVTGNVLGDSNVGGFIGSHGSSTTITKCYVTGNVTGSGSNIGGFTGVVVGIWVSNCYAWGDVSGGSNVGGFIGHGFSGGAFYSYSIGIVSGSSDVGGFMGKYTVGGTGIDCYWDTETSGTETSAAGAGHITTWLKTRSNYADTWDFDTIWDMDEILWSDSSFGIGCNSVCVIPSLTEDEVWISIGRVVNGTLVRYIERLKPRKWTDQEDMFYVDSGLTYDGASTTTITGLDHIEGETVAILADGSIQPTKVVSNGSITLSEAASVVQVGLPYTYKLKPMRMDLQTRKGTSKGSIKKFAEVVVSFENTLNARYSDGIDTYDWDWRETSAEYSTPPDLVTGDKVAVADGGFDVEDSFQIEGNDPTPCTVRAIVPRVEVTGR
jgi:hypothetical protein